MIQFSIQKALGLLTYWYTDLIYRRFRFLSTFCQDRGEYEGQLFQNKMRAEQHLCFPEYK